eukprot:gene23510-29732_t
MITDVSVVQLLLNCLNLKSLNLSLCEKLVSVTGILRQVRTHPKLLSRLLSLNLCGCALPNRNKEVDTLLGLCIALTSLDIAQVGDKDNISDSTLTTLACCCTDLTSLNISGPSAVSDEGVTTLCNACRHIAHIDLSHLPHISLKSAVEVTNKLDALRSVRCVQSEGGFSNDNALRVLASKFGTILCLDVREVKMEGISTPHRPQQFVFHFSDVEQSGSSHLNSVLDSSVDLLVGKCASLHTFAANERTTATTLHSLVAIAGPHLTSLDLSAMAPGLVDSDVMHIAASCTSLCTRLQRLSVDGCNKFSNRGVISLANACTALTSVSLQNCSKLTDKSITALMAQCEFLVELNATGCGVSKTCQHAVDLRFD